MKSRFFKDTQGLGESYTRCPPGQVCICLRMDRAAYGQILREAERLGLTSGEYIQRMVEKGGTGEAGRCGSGNRLAGGEAGRCPAPRQRV
jgi:hypothetical protein